MPDTFVTIISQAEGNDRDGFHITHYSDCRQFASKAEAVSRGFELAASDDFNVGVVRNGRLASLWWMDDRIDMTVEDLTEVGRDLGLEVSRG
jgi:hypothetical protein